MKESVPYRFSVKIGGEMSDLDRGDRTGDGDLLTESSGLRDIS